MLSPADRTGNPAAAETPTRHATGRLHVSFGETGEPDAARAVADLAARLSKPDPTLLVLFASPDYDLPALGPAIAAHFACPVLACTTAGEITATGG